MKTKEEAGMIGVGQRRRLGLELYWKSREGKERKKQVSEATKARWADPKLAKRMREGRARSYCKTPK